MTRPLERKDRILKLIKNADHDHDPYLKSFGTKAVLVVFRLTLVREPLNSYMTTLV